MPKIYSRYNLPPTIGIDTGQESIVDKNAAYDADINNIIKRYQSVEELELELASKAKPVYGDSSSPYTISEIFQMKQGLQETYSSLPDEIRSKFNNYNDFISTVGNMSDNEMLGFFSNVSSAKKQIEDMYQATLANSIPPKQTDVATSQPVDNPIQAS